MLEISAKVDAQELFEAGTATQIGESAVHGVARLLEVRRRLAAQLSEDAVQRRVVTQQEMQNAGPRRIGRISLRERFDLLGEQIERKARVLRRVVATVRDELITLDQAVVRIVRKSERREFERVEDGEVQPQVVGATLCRQFYLGRARFHRFPQSRLRGKCWVPMNF